MLSQESTHLGKPIFMDLALCKLLRWNKTVATKLSRMLLYVGALKFVFSGIKGPSQFVRGSPHIFGHVVYIGMVLWTIAVGVLKFIKKNIYINPMKKFWDCRCTYSIYSMFVQVSVFVVLSVYIYYTLNSHNGKSHKILTYFICKNTAID